MTPEHITHASWLVSDRYIVFIFPWLPYFVDMFRSEHFRMRGRDKNEKHFPTFHYFSLLLNDNVNAPYFLVIISRVAVGSLIDIDPVTHSTMI